jgi:ubiquinone/menaquinone biosynthesis C-methylase UbiE
MSIESSNDPQGFADFEHHAWETVSRGYEEHFARLTTQSVNAILDAAEVSSSKQVLDVCCGPGMITAAAIARGAEAKGIDFSAVAVEIATSNVPGAEIHEGDAQSLPFNDDSFDAVICGFGIIHVPNPHKALSEMCRVLKPGGRVAVSTWEAPNPNNGFGLLFGSIKANADMDIDLPHGPDIFQFSDPEKMSNALQETGFNEPSASTVVQTWEFKDAHGFITGIIEGSARARAIITAQTDAVQAAIADAVVAGMHGYISSDGTYRLPMPALIGSAAK